MNVIVADPLRQVEAVAPVARPLVRVVIVGHVDHGKSTLIGRLLHETGELPDGKLETLKAVCARRGMPFEWSFLLDALQTERDQGITIDTTQIRFRTPARDILLIDAPGHTEFLRNMITGAAQADAALLIVDAAEGVREQTRRHGYLLHLLGVRQVAVVVNKMDRVDFDQGRFQEIEREITGHLTGFGLMTTAVIPISARNGDGVARHTAATAWYSGPTVLGVLDSFSTAHSASELPLRFPIQAIYKFDDRRIVAGRVESGRIAVGDRILVMPVGKPARVKSIEAWPTTVSPRAAVAGQSIGITLDREIFVERGNVVSSAASPAKSCRRITARVFWLHSAPLTVGSTVVARIGTAAARGVVAAIKHAVDPAHLSETGALSIAQNHVGEIEIALSQPLAADIHTEHSNTGRVVLEFDGRIAGGGLVLAGHSNQRADAAGRPEPAITEPRRGRRPARETLAARADAIGSLLGSLSALERIVRLRQEVAGRIVFTTSFGLEDQVIAHLLHEAGVDVDVVTLDTGRLFPETYTVWAETERRYGRRIRAVYPRHADLEALVEAQGINGFYESPEARLACCHVRKVEPLNRALARAKAWITGIRADQSANRQEMRVATADIARGLIKLNPLIDWSRDQVLAFAAENNIPINSLHGQGFASIGCAPCTRALAPGEPERAGRWWWENEEKKECGLHVSR
jgi:sulfate adenylyltransferase large subunit/thioredoxin-dependent adenylylsulfate APS reductase